MAKVSALGLVGLRLPVLAIAAGIAVAVILRPTRATMMERHRHQYLLRTAEATPPNSPRHRCSITVDRTSDKYECRGQSRAAAFGPAFICPRIEKSCTRVSSPVLPYHKMSTLVDRYATTVIELEN